MPRRTAGPTAHLKVVGLKDSKASTNADRGLKGALDFLERKAGNLGKRPVVVKKVCVLRWKRRRRGAGCSLRYRLEV
jgi:hypothetical protein